MCKISSTNSILMPNIKSEKIEFWSTTARCAFSLVFPAVADHITAPFRSQLPWLDIVRASNYKTAVIVHSIGETGVLPHHAPLGQILNEEAMSGQTLISCC
jgi:hypothetical protein